jgi:Coenzyme PQQ synthesis protein D (PqqD)
MRVMFEGISRPIALIGCAHLRTCLAAVLPGWPFEEASSPHANPIIRISYCENEGYRLESPWLTEPFHDDTEVGTVCALILDLIAAYVAERPSLFCLHGAATEFAGRLVVFPSSYHAGKSSLVAGLAAAGIPVFTDDVLPVRRSGDRGVALGIAPRLRLPLPPGAGRQALRFVASHRGPSNRRYIYLDLPSGTLAPHGQQAPVGGFVLLDRQPAGRAELEPASRGQVLQRLIMQHFARSFAATEIVDRLRGLVQRVPCFSLRYARLDDAVAVLQERFAGWPGVTPEPEVPAPDRCPSPHGAGLGPSYGSAGDAAAAPQFRQHPAVTLHALDDELFLVDPRDQSIYHLNLVGAGLWRLLREPSTAAQAVEVLQAAFPDADPQQIESDASALLGDLLSNDLIVAQGLAGAAGSRQLTTSRVARAG